MGNWQPKLIPRKTLNGRRKTEIVDDYGWNTDEEDVPSTTFTVENAGVHPVTGYELQALPEGYRDKKAFKVYTTTLLRTVNEGSTDLADEVEADPGIWCKVVKVEDWTYTVQSHYLAYVVEVNER